MGKNQNLPPADAGEKPYHANGGILYWIMVIFVCNPLTMFFFNLFAPQKASKFIYTWSGSGSKLQKFYSFLANLMPFRWNKFWMSFAGIKNYGPRQRTKYYLEYETTGEVLRQLDIKEVDKLFYSQKKNKLVREQIYEFRRPSDGVFASMFLGKDVRDLRKFAHFGPFGKNIALSLVNCAKCEVLESNSDCQKFPLTDFLADYVRMFKMDNDMLEKLRDFQAPARMAEIWFSRINPAIEAFQQRMFTREQYKNIDVRPWRNFCKNTKEIYPEAQTVMSQKQHLIFYETGHTLAKKAVLYFLKDGNPSRFEMMLQWEKKKGVFKGEAKEIIEDNQMLSRKYQEFINKPKPNKDGNKKPQ